MRRDAREEEGREFSSKMPRTMSNLPDFPRRPFLYAHLCFYTKSMINNTKINYFLRPINVIDSLKGLSHEN